MEQDFCETLQADRSGYTTGYKWLANFSLRIMFSVPSSSQAHGLEWWKKEEENMSTLRGRSSAVCAHTGETQTYQNDYLIQFSNWGFLGST